MQALVRNIIVLAEIRKKAPPDNKTETLPFELACRIHSHTHTHTHTSARAHARLL